MCDSLKNWCDIIIMEYERSNRNSHTILYKYCLLWFYFRFVKYYIITMRYYIYIFSDVRHSRKVFKHSISLVVMVVIIIVVVIRTFCHVRHSSTQSSDFLHQNSTRLCNYHVTKATTRTFFVTYKEVQNFKL